MMRIGVDIGGTFTDGVVLDTATGAIRHAKSPTTPGAPIEGLTSVLGKLAVDAGDAELFVHGTTLVTNLILQRSGCRVGLITTRGFRDVLEIQRSYRADPLDIQWTKPEPIVPRHLRAEIAERTLADGTVIAVPDRDEVVLVASSLRAMGAEVLAVCLFNSYANPENERLVREWIGAALPDMPVSLSADVDAQVREYERVSTTTVNAYAIPEVRAYLRALTDALRREVLLMHSGGGVLPATAVAERPVKLVMSGPAGGVIAAQRLGQLTDERNLITFDMGGTSTDVAVIAGGQVSRAPETEVTWGIPLRAESLDIRSVGAGGGSIASKDAGGALKVGPRSAGARPGPACYGQGGTEPTVTDANLVLGIVDPDQFLGGAMNLDAEAAEKAVVDLAQEFGVITDEAAAGIHAVVNANMAQLIREMTVNQGLDPREFALVSFGGAGGQHAYAVAALVGCPRVLFPRHASAFSALGLVEAPLQTTEAQSLLLGLSRLDLAQLTAAFDVVEERARHNFGAPGQMPHRTEREVLIRYEGQTHEVMVAVCDGDDRDALYERFQQTHEGLFGTRLDDPAEIVSLHATLSIDSPIGARNPQTAGDDGHDPTAMAGTRQVTLFGRPVPVHPSVTLRDGQAVAGPALVEEGDTVIVVPPHGVLRCDGHAEVYVLDLGNGDSHGDKGEQA